MSDQEKEITGGHNTSEADEFARLFSNFMRSSIANNQLQPNQLIEANKPENATPYRIDSQPLIVGMKLNGENYAVWSVLMKTSISGRGMISHITGVPPPPARTDPMFAQWQQADHCVFTWLVQNLEMKLVSRVTQQPTAKHIWDSLAVTYASGGDAIQIYDLYRRASTLKQGNDTLEDVWNSLNEIWTAVDLKKPNRMEYPPDIDRHNEDTQNMRLYQFLTAINEKYEHTKMEILKIEPLPSPDQAYNMVKREDIRTSVLRSSEDKTQGDGIGAGLFTARDRGRPNSNSSRGGGSGSGGWNQRRYDERRTEEDKSKLVCSNCGKNC